MPWSRSQVDGTRSATMTVPRWAPTASSDSPSTGTWETRCSTPSSSRVPDQLAPVRDPRVPDRQAAPSSEGSVDTRTSRSGSAKLTDETEVCVTRRLGEGGEAGARLGLGQAGAHERAHGDLLGEAGDAAALDPLEGRRRLGQRHRGHGHEDDGDDRELEGEQLPRQRPATPPAHDHYELNLLC